MLLKTKNKPNHAYQDIASKIAVQITNGTYKEGERIPSIRVLSTKLGLSTKTIEQAYILLEGLGFIESRPQKGYFVKKIKHKVLDEIESIDVELTPKNYDPNKYLVDIITTGRMQDVVMFGPAVPSAEILPGKKLNQIISKICRESDVNGIPYEFPPGNFELRKQIAKRLLSFDQDILPDEIIITSGDTEAIVLALKAITNPGDTVIVESPSCFGVLQFLDSLKLNIIEVPSCPRSGINLELFKQAIKNNKVSACVILANINNPIGYIMPDENKKELYETCSKENIPIVEDDIYSELYFSSSRPKPIKAFDRSGIVLYCSSFSKTIAPGFRVGWICPGKFYKEVNRLKILSTYTTVTLQQMAIAEFLKSGAYERSLKNLRYQYESQTQSVSNYVADYFPQETKISKPKGGFFLWLELPKQVSSLELQKIALEEKISIAPGYIFTTHDAYMNCIRLSCGFPITPKIIKAVQTLGELTKKLM